MPEIKPHAPTKQATAKVLKTLAGLYPTHPLEVQGAEPFRVLVATMLSSRTKDPVTNAVMRSLWAKARTPQDILRIPETKLAEALKPVGFYSQKARQLHGLCRMVIERFGGGVPATREELMELPGVGRKVANLVLNICYDYPAICVDTHVHRVSNRLGWVSTETPEETEEALLKVVERKYWSMLNRVVVNHGQRVCQPLSPRCSECTVAASCPRTGVVKYR